MSVLIRVLSCLALVAAASPAGAQSYGPNIGVAAAPLRAVPGQTATGMLNWWGRQSPIYSQTDPRWANRKMGNSGETVGELGCFVAAAAMVRNLLGLSTTMRQMLAVAGRDSEFRTRGYVSGDDIVNRLFPGHAVRFLPHDGFATLEPDGKTLAILRINQTPAAEKPVWHWVLLLRHEGDDYVVLDPIDGGVRRLRDSAACTTEGGMGQEMCAPVRGAYAVTVAREAAKPAS
jgi:hypothetical protein